MWWSIQQALNACGKLPRNQYLRWDIQEHQPSDKLPPSRVWRDGIPTDRVLAGTSVISPRSRRLKNLLVPEYTFYEGNVYIVQGHYRRQGHDPGEVIITDATVIQKLGGDADDEEE